MFYYVVVRDLGALIALSVLIWKISGWKEKVNIAISKEIPDFKKDVKRGFRDMRKRIDGLYLPRTTEAQSPLRLNGFGEKISEKLEVKEWLEAPPDKHGARLMD